MAPVVKRDHQNKSMRPRVLVVDDEPTLLEMMGDIIAGSFDCKLISATGIDQARNILATQTIDLLVTDIHLPDGNGMSLLGTLHEHQPSATAIVITGDASVDRAVTAMREGAADFMPKPFSAQQMTERVAQALQRHRMLAKGERRLARLRDAVRRLSEARRVVGRKVDLLCNDLITAYSELSQQLDTVRTQEGFRKCLAEAQDLEQLLCHAMDWLLRQAGYCNVAIWLAAEESEFQLGAYMKYTITGDQELSDAMREGVVRQAVRQGIVHLSGDEARAKLTAGELRHFSDQDVLAVNCTYLGEALAVLVMFRSADKPFTAEDEAMVKLISPVLAVSLASMVKSIGESEEENELDTDDNSADRKDRRGDADWWKRGEAPPF